MTTLSPKCHVNLSYTLTTIMPSPPPSETVSKIARDLRAANRSAGVVPVASKSKPKGRKRQQSPAGESVNKRNKTAANESADVEEANDRQKGGKKGKKAKKTGEKGQKTYLFYFLIEFLF